jgi:hypothetical protein
LLFRRQGPGSGAGIPDERIDDPLVAVNPVTGVAEKKFIVARMPLVIQICRASV